MPEEQRASAGFGFGWIAAIAAAIVAGLGIIGYRQGWFDRLTNRQSNDTNVPPSSVNPTPDANQGDARTQDNQHMRQVALAMHAYHDKHGHLPTNITDANGRVLLSWRVQLLPYMGQEELYRQFHLNEAWDSPHNRQLVARMPAALAVGASNPAEGTTTVQAFRSNAAEARPSILQEGARTGTRLSAITDGTSNTIMAAEAATPVVWTRPDDLPFSSTAPTAPRLAPNGLLMLADGSVRSSRGMSDQNINAMGTISGGELIDVPALPPPSSLPPATPPGAPRR